jgi:hypothetical protein
MMIKKNFRDFDILFNKRPMLTNVCLFIVFFLFIHTFIFIFNLNTLESVLDNHWQIADIEALNKDPITALLHLHSQPPLFNFIFWLLNTAPGTVYNNFIILNSASQSLVAVLLASMAAQILNSRSVGILIGLLYIASPPVLLNAAYPFYPPLTSAGFAILTYGFLNLRSQPILNSILIGFSLCYLYLIRSSFSLPAAIIFLIIYIFIGRYFLSKVFLATLVSLTLCVLILLPLKNYFLYDFFSSSSWTPVNLIMTLGIKTPLGPFPTPKEIRSNFPDLSCKKSYGLLDTEDFKVNGEPNYNSCFYIAYINKYGSDPFTNFNLLPYLKNVKGHMGQYFNTPDGYYFLKNREQIKNYISIYNFSFFTIYFKFHQIRILCILLIIYLFIRAYQDKQYIPVILTIIFCLHFFAHVLTDGGESRRHVFDVEFIFYLIIALFISGNKSLAKS